MPYSSDPKADDLGFMPDPNAAELGFVPATPEGMARYQTEVTAQKPKTWADRLHISNRFLRMPVDVAEGMASGAASTVFHGADLLRRGEMAIASALGVDPKQLPQDVRDFFGLDRVIQRPEVQQAITAPPTTAGATGKLAEQMGEAVLMGGVTRGLTKAPLALRMGAEAATGGGIAGLQTGGDPLAMGVGAAFGGAIPAAIEGGSALWNVARGMPASVNPAEQFLESYMGNLPSSLNPTERAALEYITQQGVPVSAGTQTGNPFLKSIQKAVGHTPLGSVIAKEAQHAGERELQRVGQELAAEVHPTPINPLEAGASLQEAAAVKQAVHQTAADAQYARFRRAAADPANTHSVQVGTRPVEGQFVEDAAGKLQPLMEPVYEEIAMPVDMREIKSRLKPIYDQMVRWWEPAKRNASEGFQAVKTLIEQPDYVSAEVAERGLGGLKSLAREDQSISGGLAKLIIPRVQQLVDEAAAAAGLDVVESLRAGRAAAAEGFSTAELVKKIYAEPVTAFKQATYSGDAGITHLRKIAAEVPGELPKIGRAYIENLLERAMQGGGIQREIGTYRDWNNLGKETKKLLFRDPRLIENLDKYFHAMKLIGENPNPSGSATVGTAITMLGGWATNPLWAIAATAGTGAAAKLLYSPRGIALLQRALTTPAGTPAANALWQQLAKAAGIETAAAMKQK